ncbi:hypothetical protein ZYGNAAKF_CDS0134 [Enterococcus phage VRE9_2]
MGSNPIFRLGKESYSKYHMFNRLIQIYYIRFLKLFLAD